MKYRAEFADPINQQNFVEWTEQDNPNSIVADNTVTFDFPYWMEKELREIVEGTYHGTVTALTRSSG